MWKTNFMRPEDKLHKKLRNSKSTNEIFKSFADYYGEKADESSQRAKNMLIVIFGLFALILAMSCMC